jgi:superfamily I DNA/RNA helicase
MELDAIVLLMLRNARELLGQAFVARELDAPRFESLRNLADLFRQQIMVDKATDFSVLQLACMESLTALKARSFFACGDFNQRITRTGVRSMDQIGWISPRIEPRTVSIVYRQSRQLNQFAAALLPLIDGDESALAVLPEHSTHEGVPPVLREQAGDLPSAAQWVAARIVEVERGVQQMPTIAVLVNSESEVRPMAQELSAFLEEINLKACPVKKVGR